MKIYIGKGEVNEQYRKIEEPQLISYIAEDAECTEIVVDGVLRSMNLSEIQQYLVLLRQKTRLNGVLILKDIDFDILHYVYDKNNNIEELNKTMFSSGTPLNSLLKYEIILPIATSLGYELVVKNTEGLDFILVLRRVG